MKKSILFLVSFIVTFTFGQPPIGYYNTATGTGYTLKTQLYNIIKNHNDQGYSGLYTTYQTSDVKSNGKVWDMYSNCNFTFGLVANGGNQDNGSNVTTECVLFNREHTVPQSYFGNGIQPMYSDAHFVIPSDKIVNAKRDDFPFGVVTSPTWTSLNGSKLGPNSNSGYTAGYAGTVFEPIDEYKGDIARVLFYFVTRYENQLVDFFTTSTSTVKAMFDGSNNQSFSLPFINILLTWSNNDPVSSKEIARNNAIYTRQNNRNPYIDHPEYAMQIWGNLLQNAKFNFLEYTKIYPNPCNTNAITIETKEIVNQIELIHINGQIIQEIKNPIFENNTFKLYHELPKGFYLLKLTNDLQTITKKFIIN